MPAEVINKEQFLLNLERALKKVLCDRLDDDVEIKKQLANDIEEFISENVSLYSLEELTDTFLSAQMAIGLFYEYQDAKRLAANRDESELSDGPGNSTRSEWREPLTGMDFIWIPGGSFDMGAGYWDDQAASDEQPVHEVNLNGFWMGKFPVTVAQYKIFASEQGDHRPVWYDPDNPSGILETAPTPYRENPASVWGPSFPVTGVSWHDGVAFTKWLFEKSGFHFRLPSEAQWEYAARSCGQPEKYSGGLPVEEVGWFQDNSGGRAHRVGTLAPNAMGLYDMCGNVAEWCLDMYRRNGYESHAGTDPVILSGQGTRAVRGGSFRYGAKDLRCADRGHYVPENREYDLGLRLVRVS